MKLRLRPINNGLSLIIILICLYTFLFPFIPQAEFAIAQAFDDRPTSGSEIFTQQTEATEKNTLYIPSILLTKNINEGRDLSALRNGVWRRPLSAMPDSNGNTVIVGHRFTYDGASDFYNLDKVKKGDTVGVRWEGENYLYEVTDIQVVSADEVGVEAPTNDRRLTLYTCTPLWSAKNRLVITAIFKEQLS